MEKKIQKQRDQMAITPQSVGQLIEEETIVANL